jgi:hypothetical protein
MLRFLISVASVRADIALEKLKLIYNNTIVWFIVIFIRNYFFTFNQNNLLVIDNIFVDASEPIANQSFFYLNFTFYYSIN